MGHIWPLHNLRVKWGFLWWIHVAQEQAISRELKLRSLQNSFYLGESTFYTYTHMTMTEAKKAFFLIGQYHSAFLSWCRVSAWLSDLVSVVIQILFLLHILSLDVSVNLFQMSSAWPVFSLSAVYVVALHHCEYWLCWLPHLLSLLSFPFLCFFVLTVKALANSHASISITAMPTTPQGLDTSGPP